MPTDVIIEPSSGQIYWNDSGGIGSSQSISIAGNAVDQIRILGYGFIYTLGGSAGASTERVIFNDSLTSTIKPGANGSGLGDATYSWDVYAYNSYFRQPALFQSTNNSTSLFTGSIQSNGGIAVSGNASIGQSLNIFNSTDGRYFVGFRAAAGLAATTTYTLPTGYPGTGTSVLQSDTSGTLTWIPVSTSGGSATTASNVNVSGAATSNFEHRIVFTTASTSVAGAALSQNSTLSYNPSSDILFSSGILVTSGTDSTNTTSGALQVRGGIGATGISYFQTISVASLTGTGNAVIQGNFTFNGVGVFGNATTDTINSLARYISDILPSADNSYDLGNNALGWRNFRVSGVGTVATLTVTSSTVSTSTTTGALTVTGGVGIGGSLYTATGSSSSVSGVILANGNVSATTYNKLTLTAPATSATLTLANGSSLITSGGHSLTFNTSNTTSLTLPTTGTLATTSNKLSDFAATTSLELLGVISDETGSGALVFANTPTLVTPTLGVATATSINKLTLTAPATSATLTLANGSSLITSGGHSLTFNTSNTTSLTLPTTGTLATTSNKLSDFAATTSLELKNTISDETGSGALVFATSPDFTTSVTTGSATFSVFNATATNISAFGAATTLSIGAATGKATINSVDNSTSSTTGAFVVTGGAAVGQSLSIAGRLQMFNGANYSAFKSGATSNQTYTLPIGYPGTGTSVLASDTSGNMTWVPSSGGGGGSGVVNSGVASKIAYYPTSTTTVDDATGMSYTEFSSGTAVTFQIFGGAATGNTIFTVSGIGQTLVRVGIGVSNPQYELEINGELSATNKSFVINHPTKPGMKLRYGSLEGPENGVYVRGELKNTKIIVVPDHWYGLVDIETYTVHLTPIGTFAQLFVVNIEDYNVEIADSRGLPIHCYYSVWAERKDIPKLVTEY